MKRLILIIGIIAALLAASCSRGDDVNSLVKLYYVPIGAETYTPVTLEDIEKRGSYTELSASDKRYRRLMSIIGSASSGLFDENAVRAKIVTDGDAIYIDNNGGLKLPVSTGKLSASELSAAKKVLDNISKK